MRLHYYTADVFTDRVFGGNPLAVFEDGGGLSARTMQLIARELNLSETVFVLAPERPEHTAAIRIFTPAVELPFAGHPTIGTAHVLAAIGRVELAAPEVTLVLEEEVGPVEVSVQTDGERPLSARLRVAQTPEFGPPPPPVAELAPMLGLDVADIVEEPFTAGAVSCGVPFLLVPLADRGALGRARIDPDLWHRTLQSYWAPHVYLFTVATMPRLRARMFAPAMGIVEDPATGAAAADLAAYLAALESRDGRYDWWVEQGVEMGRSSLLELAAERRDGEIAEVWVGGATVQVGEGWIEIPEEVLVS